MSAGTGAFLSAEWRHLVILNYAVDRSILVPYVPEGTELDPWEGECLVSVVGFQFRDTRLLGVPVPFHRDFEEVNLRFYVRRETSDGARRGVVFIKEIVPRRAIAWVARCVYNENYVALPMSHVDMIDAEADRRVTYRWRFRGRSQHLSARVSGEPTLPPSGSYSEFITDHSWGYSRQRNGSTLEYRVEHPRWAVWGGDDAELDCGADELYGEEFADPLAAAPLSAFVARGSGVVVRWGVKLRA